MLYTVEDLVEVNYNIDKYIEIFEHIVYQNISPLKSFEKISRLILNFWTNKSILFPIIENNRIDVIQKLYLNNIMVHRYAHILNNILEFAKYDMFVLAINNGFDFTELNVKSYAEIFNYILIRANIDTDYYNLIYKLLNMYKYLDGFMSIILTESIKVNNYCVLELILKNSNKYLIPIERFFDIMHKFFIDDVLLSDIMLLKLSIYDLDKN